MARPLDDPALSRLLRDQSGVVSRRQIEACGSRPHDIERWVRRRDLARLLPGVFVDHTGEPTWVQRAWAGALHYGPGQLRPTALAADSALRAVAGPGWRRHDDTGPIHLAIEESRRCAATPGYRVRRVRGLDTLVQWNSSPPRMRVEEAALDVVCAQRTELQIIGTLADLCQSRRTTAARIRETADRRSRLPRRDWLRTLLNDIADGTCSTLEHGYLSLVERPHGLPGARRQQPATAGPGAILRDVDYDPLRLIVELDGRLFHDSASQRDRDLDRDLAAAVDGRRTVRLGWGQVYERPCRTADQVGTLLVQRGWTGRPVRCGPDCRLGEITAESAS